MENRNCNQQLDSSSFSSSFSRNPSPNSLGSPKFIRKKDPQLLDSSFNLKKKKYNAKEGATFIGFISPKKTLDQITHHRQSLNKLISPMNQNHPIVIGSPKIESQTLALEEIKPENQNEKKISNPQQINAIQKKMMKQNNLLNEENIKLKDTCRSLQMTLDQYQSKNSRLKEENQYLYQKIEGFNQIIGNKVDIIFQLENSLYLKQDNLKKCQDDLTIAHSNINNLKFRIKDLQKIYDETSFKEKFGSEEDKEQQLIIYKKRIVELTEKVKYVELQQTLGKKVKSDLYESMRKNKILQLQNRKLFAKIEKLMDEVTFKENIASETMRKNRVSREISFELSPDK